jgi:hypothetical protein
MVQLKYLKKTGLLATGKIKMGSINCTKHGWQGVVREASVIGLTSRAGLYSN